MASTTEALAALARMQSIVNAFENAKQVIEALENAEQVGRELEAVQAKVRTQIANCTAEFADLTGRIEEQRQAARAEAERVVSEAKAAAARIVAEAKAAAENAKAEQLAAEQARDDALVEQGAAEIALEAAKADHAEIDARSKTLREAAASILRG